MRCVICPTHPSGWPKLLWFVTESKHLSKPPRDWFPHIKDANNDTAYIEVKTFLNFVFFPLIHPNQTVLFKSYTKYSIWICPEAQTEFFFKCCPSQATRIVLWSLIGGYIACLVSSSGTEINISCQHAGPCISPLGSRRIMDDKWFMFV